jgi:hypothetical protein
MKRQAHLFLSGLALAFSLAVHGQGTFQNLGFESASLVAIPEDPYGSVQFNNAFPGWVAYVGGVQQDRSLYNNVFLDSSGISIIDNGFPLYYFGAPVGVISGRFTAILQAGTTGPTATPADTTLSQTSLVPVSAESLRFRAYFWPNYGPLRVLLGGQQLALTPLASGTNYTVYGADIHSWQGQVAQLDFTVLAGRPHVDNNNVYLDSIQFSPQPIPEPDMATLFACGIVLLGSRMFRRSHEVSKARRLLRLLDRHNFR